MNESLEQTIRRLELCRDCIDCSYEAGAMEYMRLDTMIEGLRKQKKELWEVINNTQQKNTTNG